MLMKHSLFLLFVCWYCPLLLKAQADSASEVQKLLGLSLEELMNIKVVTSTGYLQSANEAPSTIQVITAQQIRERGYQQLEDALRDIPGIDMIHINGYAPTLFYFRGMYGAENLRALLMIDGIAENNIIGNNDMAGPAYSLHNVSRIEIIWGPASALYGANAFGGVINIITKKGADINGLYAEKGTGSFNTSVTKVALGLMKSNIEFSLSGSLYSTDGPVFKNRDPDYKGSYVDNAYSFNGTVSYYGKKSKSTLGFRSYRTPMGWGTYANSPTVYLGLPPQGNGNTGVIGMASADIRGQKAGLEDSYLRTGFIQHEYTPNKKFNMLGRIVYRETGTGENSYSYSTTDGTKLIRNKVASYSNRISGELSLNYTPAEKHQLSAGIQFYQDNVEAGFRKSTFDSTVYLLDGRDTLLNLRSSFLPRQYDIRNNFGSYFQYVLNTSLLGKTNLTAGLRYDRNSYFGDAVSPRIVLVNNPEEKLTFKLQFGMAFRAPTNLEIYQAGLNFQLETEKLKTYEVNTIYSPSKNLKLYLNFFRNQLRDVIFINSLSGLNPDKNPGSIDVNGIEAGLNTAFAKHFSGFVNFTYQDGTSKNLVTHASVITPAVAAFKANAGITASIKDLIIVNLTGNWVGARRVQRTNPHGPVSDYLLMNFTIGTKPLFNDRVSASINIHNLFDKKWLDPGFRTADGSLYATVLEQPGINGLFKICFYLNNR